GPGPRLPPRLGNGNFIVHSPSDDLLGTVKMIRLPASFSCLVCSRLQKKYGFPKAAAGWGAPPAVFRKSPKNMLTKQVILCIMIN
ncbi:MAG: hypothetical protein PUE14_10060, partial [Clostridia bacterium]|nr:hypothetical protein [Clostridia bacterium]